MPPKKIPLYDLHVTPAARAQITKTLNSGWLSSGPRVLTFEKTLAQYLGVKYVAAVNSATSGLILALKSIGVGPGSEVITTPLTFAATVSSILHCGAEPVLADIDPSTLTIDPADISRKMSRRTACIMPVDVAGQPCDYAALTSLSRNSRIPIVSDSAHAFGADYHGRSIAKLVNLSVYSFHATKNLTCGEGGLVTARKRETIERVRLLSRHAMTANAYARRMSGGWEYDVSDLGYKANMSDIHAAIGLGQLIEFDKQQKARFKLVERYYRNLTPLAEFVELPAQNPGVHSAWHLYIIKLNLKRLQITRNQFISMMSDHGIECGVHYLPIYDFSYFRRLGLSGRNLPNTRAVADRLVTLPLYAQLKPEQIDFISECIARILRKHAR